MQQQHDQVLAMRNDQKRDESIAFLRSFTPSKYIKDGAPVNWKHPTILAKAEPVLDGMSKSEYEAYDYGCTSIMDAVTKILDGKDAGLGTANEPWESLRRRLLSLSAPRGAMGIRLHNR